MRFILAAAAVLLALPGLAGADTDATANVTIQNSTYQPPLVFIHPGDTVVWTNQDQPLFRHTVTDLMGAYDSPFLVGPGATFSHTFTEQGISTYYCKQHAQMRGIVIVQ